MYKATLQCSICGPIRIGRVKNEREAREAADKHMKNVHNQDENPDDFPVEYE